MFWIKVVPFLPSVAELCVFSTRCSSYIRATWTWWSNTNTWRNARCSSHIPERSRVHLQHQHITVRVLELSRRCSYKSRSSVVHGVTTQKTSTQPWSFFIFSASRDLALNLRAKNYDLSSYFLWLAWFRPIRSLFWSYLDMARNIKDLM